MLRCSRSTLAVAASGHVRTDTHALLCCADASEENIVVEFGDDPASAVLMSDILTHKTTSVTPACLSLHYSVSSLDVNIMVALSTSPENLSSSRQVDVTHSRHTSHYWQRSVVISAGERLFITASKLRATRRSVTYASLSNISLTQGNCSSDSAEGKFSRISESIYTTPLPYLLSYIDFYGLTYLVMSRPLCSTAVVFSLLFPELFSAIAD